MQVNDTKVLRDHLLWLLRGGHAHVFFDRAVAALPVRFRGMKPAGLPYSSWMLVEHMRLAQWDILEFSRKPRHVSPKWPEGYWPKTAAPPDPSAWRKTVDGFQRDLGAMMALVKNPSTDLYEKIPHGDGQTILREALLLADHNAYHLGQLIVVRRMLGAWKEQ